LANGGDICLSEVKMKPSRIVFGALGALLLSTGLAAAASAVATTDLNVRAGQGTNHPVIGVLPAGAAVDVRGCADGWCYVSEYGGYASARYLDGARYAMPVSPPVYGYDPFYTSPGIGFAFEFGAPRRHYYWW
jgi:uncharacterized protein YraI